MKVTLLLCKNRGRNEKAIPVAYRRLRTNDRSIDRLRTCRHKRKRREKFALKFELKFKPHNNSSKRAIIMRDKSQSRQYFGAMLSHIFCAERYGTHTRPRAIGFLISSLFRRFLCHFSFFFFFPNHGTRALEGGNCGEKLLFARTVIIATRFCEGSWELFLCGPQDAKMMFAPIWELRTSFAERMIASLLGTLAWPDPRLLYIFAILRFNFPCLRCK